MSVQTRAKEIKAPTSIQLQRDSDGNIELYVEIHRGWRFWLPKTVMVKLEGAAGIWFYQTIHKFFKAQLQEPDWAPNVAAAIQSVTRARELLKLRDEAFPLPAHEEVINILSRTLGQLGVLS